VSLVLKNADDAVAANGPGTVTGGALYIDTWLAMEQVMMLVETASGSPVPWQFQATAATPEVPIGWTSIVIAPYQQCRPLQPPAVTPPAPIVISAAAGAEPRAVRAATAIVVAARRVRRFTRPPGHEEVRGIAGDRSLHSRCPLAPPNRTLRPYGRDLAHRERQS
jgi:hypothetical protein